MIILPNQIEKIISADRQKLIFELLNGRPRDAAWIYTGIWPHMIRKLYKKAYKFRKNLMVEE